MGYTKIIQYGNVTEIYEYEKNLSNTRRSHVSSRTKKRNKAILDLRKSKGVYERSKASVRRSRNNFFRLCHHNIVNSDTVHFLTLTFIYDPSFKTATRHVAHFMERVKKNYPQISLSYISVPELTKKGRLHFHILLFNLPPEISRVERTTRNLQRLFQRGYIDLVRADYTSKGIAGYMSKYMGKALTDFKNESTRGYNCSQNIKKIYYAGSNTLSAYSDLVYPQGGDNEKRSYDVPFLGRCNLTINTKN